MKARLLCAAIMLTCLAPASIALAQDALLLPFRPARRAPLHWVGRTADCDDGGCESCVDDSCCGAGDSMCSGFPLYASVNLRGSFDHLRSGGFNDGGDFFNTGTDDNQTFS